MAQCGTESHGYASWGSGARLERFAAVQMFNGRRWESPERRDSGTREELLTRPTHQLTTTAGLPLTDAQVRRVIRVGDSEPVQFRVERATEHDVGLILRLIEGLAEYERLSHEVVATEAELRESLFGHRPAAEVIIGYAGQVPAGFAVFFQNFSTFLGRSGAYL